MIKKFKPLYWIYNFFRKGELEYNLPLLEKYGIEKQYFESFSAQDFAHLESPLNKYDALDSASEMPDDPLFKEIPDRFQNSLLQWSEKGYVILEAFLSANQVEEINLDVDKMIQDQKVNFRYQGKKIMAAYLNSALINSIGTDQILNKILQLLLGKEVQLFSSINFIKGSEQRTHSDSIHMTTYPVGNLIAVWVALEDINEDNGPLHYYPGSHKLDYVMNKDFGNKGNRLFLGKKNYVDYEDKIEEIILEKKLVKQAFHAKKGDILIWHANLLHGGNKMNDPTLTRKSMVFHYYSKDAICYHEITQRPSLMRKYSK